MNTLLLTSAKRDIPLYLNEFNHFWKQTESTITDEELIKCYLNTLIFKNWKLALNHVGIYQMNSILDEICEDINLSFYLAYFGQYRSSHMHLRSLIELSLQNLYFYQHEIEFGQWKLGNFRIKHEDLTNYLKKHPNLNFPNNETLIAEITKYWQLFSKYIHAEAPAYFQTNLVSTQTNNISTPDFNIWKSNFIKIGYKLNKLFLFFFKEKINLFPTQTKDILLKNLRDVDIRELGFEP